METKLTLEIQGKFFRLVCNLDLPSFGKSFLSDGLVVGRDTKGVLTPANTSTSWLAGQLVGHLTGPVDVSFVLRVTSSVGALTQDGWCHASVSMLGLA